MPASLPGDLIRWIVGAPRAVFDGYRWLLESGVDAARSLYDDYGYWVVFLGTLFENTLLLGLIIPGAVVVILAGLSAQEGLISWPLAVLLGTLGTIAGDTISYHLGRFGWARSVEGGSLRTFTERIRGPLLRRGALFVLVYHFAGYTRVVGPAAAGLLRMPYRQWAPADYAGAFLWICAYFGVGYLLGVAGLSLDSTEGWFRVFEWVLLAAVLLWGLYLYRSRNRGWVRAARRRLAGDPEERVEAVGGVAAGDEPSS
jgi:membrane protein DedA with SNARE-associated domain